MLEAIEEVLGLRLGVLELAGQDLEVVAALHRAHLLVHDLLVHPRDAPHHVGDGGGLLDGTDVQGDGERYGEVDDGGGEAVVRELASEAPERERRHQTPSDV